MMNDAVGASSEARIEAAPNLGQLPDAPEIPSRADLFAVTGTTQSQHAYAEPNS
jgi:hypothetical protein